MKLCKHLKITLISNDSLNSDIDAVKLSEKINTRTDFEKRKI